MSIAYGGDQITFPDASTQNTGATGFGFKNRIINGAMVVSQRNNGASVTPTTDGTYTLDRWRVGITVSSKFSVQQTATAPTGFVNSLNATSLSAYSVGAGDAFLVTQAVEGYNVSDLGWGTASAKTVTLSFQVYSSLTGTFGGSVYNSAGNRSYPFSYSVPVANTWTSISITIAGDTSGTWLTTNGIGLQISFGLGVGTNFSGTAGAWAGSLYFSATGAVSVVGTSGATFYITGVQLEKGSTATSFDYRPYGTELQLCQRYYSLNTVGCGRSTSTTRMSGTVGTPVSMRATPTVSLFNGTNKAIDIGVALRNVTSIVVLEGATEYGGNITADVSTTTSGVVHTYLGGCFAWSSEL
jgi:hypothetical protein